ncbi:MAG TPA: hypothetical protein VF881_18700 [Polyangiaceae bacterium]
MLLLACGNPSSDSGAALRNVQTSSSRRKVAPSGFLRLSGLVLMSIALAFAPTACWWSENSQERKDCDKALEIVCHCPSIDCAANPPLPIVQTLRACSADEIFRYRGYHLSLCIQNSSAYCTVVSGLVTSSTSVCRVECSNEIACDQEQACHEYQFSRCGVPPSDAGSSDAP